MIFLQDRDFPTEPLPAFMLEKKNSLRMLLRCTLTVLTGLFFFACANVVSPAGGPADETPPSVVRSTPPNYSPNFQGQEIRIFFDEFVQLKEINQKLLISPPLENQPEVRLKGKSVILEISDTLRSNTTYNFFFGDAISDITESNPIPNFQFVVSTGPFVDSLSIRGQVNDSFTLEAVGGVYVMLYDNLYDSVPYLERPVYLSKTNKQGFFEITNMRDGKYKIFALEDLNSNFLFDLPNERIAFLDSLISPEYVEPAPETPSPGAETEPAMPGAEESVTQQTGDLRSPELPGAFADSLGMVASASGYQLRMFLEADTLQRVVSSSVPRNGLVNLVFRVPFDTISLRDLSDTLRADWHIPEPSFNRDSLSLWMRPPLPDSLWLEVSDGALVIDTIRISARPREARGRGGAETTTPPLGIRLNAGRSSPLPYFENLTFTAAAPLQQFNREKINLVVADSVAVDFSMDYADEIQRRVVLTDTLGQGLGFTMDIFPGAFTDIYGNTNDTIRASFSTTLHEDYGLLILNLELTGDQGSFILHLVDKDGNTLIERQVEASGAQEYNNLLPGNYGFRLILDQNGNGEWDTGNYLQKIQPEPVYLYRGVLQIRQNWETEINWPVNL